ncbi:phosphoribosylanthranilate isomerase [Bacillus sp. B15-48]|uniref:phosphoribosylanthranilate isomerase n=1 Tax=Bacillus sp. B15-48 TaxID=1548601 RepID=UPI00193FDAC6|nr:phosphoribosylanthranilate isomerase [Bacillus sp. B15-48]MBM4761967.1 N-(5'-phosphoribosyl)anthranilate isomerase [Bacillus sp. B15-48]
MKVKICGVRSTEIALQAVEAGADALGFVFATSKRQIGAEQAREIIKELPENIWKVGVFVNESLEKIADIVEIAGLTHIQLHGEENPGHYVALGKPIIKSLSISSDEDIKRLDTFKTDYILLDSPPALYKGGNGTSFEWGLAAGNKNRGKIILAGGLDSENVKKAIDTVQPAMVDVSSGVETDGEKDINKIRSFIKQAKGVS